MLPVLLVLVRAFVTEYRVKEVNNHRAKKSLGQNFLQDQNICRKIVDAIDPSPEDSIFEIGPGKGALTEFLVEAGAKHLTVIEKDSSLAQRLDELYPQLEVAREDALKYDWTALNRIESCKIIGNLPYNVASKLIWDIVSTVETCTKAVFMVQHEVALRLTATPGNKAYGGLTAWVKNFSTTRYLFKVPPTVFRPQPKVDSAVVELAPLPKETWPSDPQALSSFIKQLFQKRRKQLSTILKKQWSDEIASYFDSNDIPTTSRPENLTPEQFRALSLLS